MSDTASPAQRAFWHVHGRWCRALHALRQAEARGDRDDLDRLALAEAAAADALAALGRDHDGASFRVFKPGDIGAMTNRTILPLFPPARSER